MQRKLKNIEKTLKQLKDDLIFKSGYTLSNEECSALGGIKTLLMHIEHLHIINQRPKIDKYSN